MGSFDCGISTVVPRSLEPIQPIQLGSLTEKQAICPRQVVVNAKPDRKKASCVFLLGLVSGLILPPAWRALHPEVQAQEAKMPFASSIDQRQQTVEELRKLNALM